ncbi:MAG TPA: tetratricopeptide repeat protein [Candidatus Melainabacteria bacterium]|nr:tetratricopeptide repeat protein [Candidatus Melainabacteria bacterium]HIN67168.1 tetratricopeptide repeat protein [Candidatus Obscuribacterales bacterium]
MLKQIVIALSSVVMLSGACWANDIEVQEKIRTKSGEWMAQMRQVDKLKAQKKWDEAEAIIRKIMDERQELKLNLSGEKRSLAELFTASGKLADAEKMYKEQIADRETHDGVEDFILVPVLNQYAEFLRAHGRAKEAVPIEQRAKAIEADVNKPPKKQIAAIMGDAKLNNNDKYSKLCDLGKRYLDSDNATKASFACTEAIKVNPYKSRAYKMRAQTYYQLEKLQLALDDLNNALKADPKDAEALFDRGRLYQSLNKPLKALKDFDSSIALRPDDVDTLGYRAKQYAALGQIDKAIADYTAAIKAQPRSHWAYIQRSLLYRDNKKDTAQALKDIDKALSLAPRNIDDWELRAETLMKARRMKEATADATKMIEIEPQSTQGYSMRSRIYKTIEGPKSKNAAADLATIEKLRKAPQ